MFNCEILGIKRVAVVAIIGAMWAFSSSINAQSRSFSFDCIGDIKSVEVGGSNKTGQGYLQVHFDNQRPRQEGEYSFIGNELKVETQVGSFYWNVNTQRGEVRWGRLSATCRG